jgi:hypothetical protein
LFMLGICHSKEKSNTVLLKKKIIKLLSFTSFIYG